MKYKMASSAKHSFVFFKFGEKQQQKSFIDQREATNDGVNQRKQNTKEVRWSFIQSILSPQPEGVQTIFAEQSQLYVSSSLGQDQTKPNRPLCPARHSNIVGKNPQLGYSGPQEPI